MGLAEPTYQLQTDEERKALALLEPTLERLMPVQMKGKHREMFHRIVLTHLALIDAARKNASGPPPKDRKVAERFKRRAIKVRNSVDRMQKPMPEPWAAAVGRRAGSWRPAFPWSRFPSDELLRYAQACDRAAAFFSGQTRHAGDPQSAHIVKLLNFVHLYTGEPHLEELAELLKRPCADKGMNAKRLDQLLRDHADQYPEVRREAEQAEAGIGAFLVKQILSEPPDC